MYFVKRGSCGSAAVLIFVALPKRGGHAQCACESLGLCGGSFSHVVICRVESKEWPIGPCSSSSYGGRGAALAE